MTRELAIKAIQDFIGWFKEDSLIRKALEMAIHALSQEPTDKPMCDRNICLNNEYNGIGCDECVVTKLPSVTQKPNFCASCKHYADNEICLECEYDGITRGMTRYESVTHKSGKWIPVSERLPEDLEPVNITWVNHNPESYYKDIKDKPFTATGHYCSGRWWWYSVTCQDYLNEYGRCDVDAMDDDIEIIAWMPLPKPYEPQEGSDKE